MPGRQPMSWRRDPPSGHSPRQSWAQNLPNQALEPTAPSVGFWVRGSRRVGAAAHHGRSASCCGRDAVCEGGMRRRPASAGEGAGSRSPPAPRALSSVSARAVPWWRAPLGVAGASCQCPRAVRSLGQAAACGVSGPPGCGGASGARVAVRSRRRVSPVCPCGAGVSRPNQGLHQTPG